VPLLALIFLLKFKEELSQKAADELRKAERRKRHQIEDLRSALKKMDPPIGLDVPYEQAVALMQDLKEFRAIEDEETRAAAFAKYVRKQKVGSACVLGLKDLY
jgi:pre-mRNA-processing factor 40